MGPSPRCADARHDTPRAKSSLFQKYFGGCRGAEPPALGRPVHPTIPPCRPGQSPDLRPQRAAPLEIRPDQGRTATGSNEPIAPQQRNKGSPDMMIWPKSCGESVPSSSAPTPRTQSVSFARPAPVTARGHQIQLENLFQHGDPVPRRTPERRLAFKGVQGHPFDRLGNAPTARLPPPGTCGRQGPWPSTPLSSASPAPPPTTSGAGAATAAANGTR